MSEAPEVFATEAAQVLVEEGHGGAPTHAEPELLGFAPFQWVSIAMAVLLLIAFFYVKVHKTIAGGLDNKIAAIKQQLDEAKELRSEAEKLRDEYAAKISNAEKDAEAMVEGAKREADAILDKAEADSKAMVERRKKMAEDKISAAERDAVEEVRSKAAQAATAAARNLIKERHGVDDDRKLADQVISSI
ncbi:ATP synthase F0 sector subunit b [Altererythrobacter epoxidivorans]|uniref:ATP synthase subunit b n=1 Tax=Altererythrobacter epoxidivorans TaxID=361183 RepID=A0A0M4MTQ3_9SPHN|nr:ATP synthase subunit B [Altererythrobacter epoxidivorans]ALE16720.1 ATP synthase F0 sector subunit b [Altererythrobacter epoxidivorans]